METVWWFCVVSFLNAAFGSPEASYTVQMNQLSFADAQNYCRAGSFLTNLKNEAEIAKIQKAIWEKNNKTATAFWIGLKKRKGECVQDLFSLKGFRWTVDNGQYLNGIRWKETVMRTCTDERCGLLALEYGDSGTRNVGLVSAACKQKHPFICKRNTEMTCDPPSILGTRDIIENKDDRYTCQVICDSGATFTLTCSNDLWTVVGNENTNISQLCLQCDSGYRRDASGNCVDINECDKPNPCKNQCVNTEGSYKCLCLNTDRDSDDCSESTTPALDLKHDSMDLTHSNASRGKSLLIHPTTRPDDARSNETTAHMEEKSGDISNIVIAVIVALLMLVVLLVITVAIVKCCVRRRTVKLSQRKAEAVALST